MFYSLVLAADSWARLILGKGLRKQINFHLDTSLKHHAVFLYWILVLSMSSPYLCNTCLIYSLLLPMLQSIHTISYSSPLYFFQATPSFLLIFFLLEPGGGTLVWRLSHSFYIWFFSLNVLHEKKSGVFQLHNIFKDYKRIILATLSMQIIGFFPYCFFHVVFTQDVHMGRTINKKNIFTKF